MSDSATDFEAKSVFDLIDGMTPIQPSLLAAFETSMTQEVIPEIVEVVEERRVAAAESYHCQLKY